MATMRWLVLGGLIGLAACSSTSPTEPSLSTSGAEQHTVTVKKEGGSAPRGCQQVLGFPQICSGRN
jgi:hypothetical protein